MKTKENANKSIKNVIRNIFYKTDPCGISLIVLVITIIVIIILATAIIISVLNNNPLSEANKARFQSDRDNMQSIFTNTVAKVMAVNQSSIKIKAGELNSMKSGVNSTIGQAEYFIETNDNNISGNIIFDNDNNKENNYYTGKQLPIYKSGETTWYVDKDGVLKLQVGKLEVSENGNSNDLKDKNNDTEMVSKEEYDKLKNQVTNLVERLEDLENKSSNFERVELTNSNLSIPITTTWEEKDFGNIVFSDTLDNYKYLEINVEMDIINKSDNKHIKACETTQLISINNLAYNNTNTSDWTNSSIFSIKITRVNEIGYDIYMWLKDNKTLHVGAAITNDTNFINGSVKIKSVYGIK